MFHQTGFPNTFKRMNTFFHKKKIQHTENWVKLPRNKHESLAIDVYIPILDFNSNEPEGLKGEIKPNVRYKIDS